MNSKRPTSVMVALVLLVLLSLDQLVALLPGFPGANQIPSVVIVGSVVAAIIGLVGAYGLWLLKRWGMILAIIASVLIALGAAPGIPFAPTVLLHISATLSVVLSIVVIVLVLLPSARKAYAAEAQHVAPKPKG